VGKVGGERFKGLSLVVGRRSFNTSFPGGHSMEVMEIKRERRNLRRPRKSRAFPQKKFDRRRRPSVVAEGKWNSLCKKRTISHVRDELLQSAASARQ